MPRMATTSCLDEVSRHLSDARAALLLAFSRSSDAEQNMAHTFYALEYYSDAAEALRGTGEHAPKSLYTYVQVCLGDANTTMARLAMVSGYWELAASSSVEAVRAYKEALSGPFGPEELAGLPDASVPKAGMMHIGHQALLERIAGVEEIFWESVQEATKCISYPSGYWEGMFRRLKRL